MILETQRKHEVTWQRYKSKTKHKDFSWEISNI